MSSIQIYQGELTPPIEAMEHYFQKGGISIVEAAFKHSYFIHPEAVRANTPFFPDRARRSLEHYPGKKKGEEAVWHGNGKAVTLDDNQYAQLAWERYTGKGLARGSGYGVRHIWGNPWDPQYFTAGWNLCYMPFWAGMLTEKQHQHPELERAVRQASWDLYFRSSPVCKPPESVKDPKLDLGSLLAGQPILILAKAPASQNNHIGSAEENASDSLKDTVEQIKSIRSRKHQSWSNIRKAFRALQDLPHEPFGTPNVENSAKSCARSIRAETDLSFAEIELLLDQQGW